MKDLALDLVTHDLALSAFDLPMVEQAAQVQQSLTIRLLFFRAEWFLDITAGVPYYQSIFGKQSSRLRAESLLKQAIVTTPGVRTLTAFASSYDGHARTFRVDAKVETMYGPVPLEVTL